MLLRNVINMKTFFESRQKMKIPQVITQITNFSGNSSNLQADFVIEKPPKELTDF